MKNLMTQVLFKRGLTAKELQGLQPLIQLAGVHMASVGIWQDEDSLQYELNDDLDFWLQGDVQMVCPLRICALACLTKKSNSWFYIPLLELPVKELLVSIPNEFVGWLPTHAYTHETEM
jgi:hypothetical protein